MQQFEAEGIRYLPAEGKTDYARGNGGSRFANGWTASRVYYVLQAAAFSGDRELIAQALQKLRALDRYDNGVPRGAQAWELSLHTPDILASANLVHAYALGYELTGDIKMLERARYWAWTGVPFVYLTPPTAGKVGLSTLAVYGATGWVGSWFGRPVQWNGLVYADALRHLARYDKASPWKKLADGITVSGIQQSWPASDEARQGLLPDVYLLVPQVSDGPAINPGTVQSNAAPLYTDAPLYDFRALRGAGFFVHAPGKIEVESQNARGATFTVRGWPSETYYVLISGLPRGAAAPTVTVNGAPFSTAPENYLPNEGRLILPLNGTAKISIAKP